MQRLPQGGQGGGARDLGHGEPLPDPQDGAHELQVDNNIATQLLVMTRVQAGEQVLHQPGVQPRQ